MKWGAQKQSSLVLWLTTAVCSHGGWGLIPPVVSVLSVVVVVIVPALGWLVGWRPERGGSHQEHDHRQDHPGHGHHGEGVVWTAAIGTRQLAILVAFVVCAVGLGLAQEVQQPPHRHLVAENAFTRIEVAPVRHLDPRLYLSQVLRSGQTLLKLAAQ